MFEELFRKRDTGGSNQAHRSGSLRRPSFSIPLVRLLNTLPKKSVAARGMAELIFVSAKQGNPLTR
jgi:hypothetical protein